MVVVMETRELRAVGAGERGDRDRELVRLIGRHGAMTLKQVMRAMGAGRTATYRRFARCEEAGLVERLRIPGSGPAVLHATRDGLRYAGLGLPVAAISPGGVDHMLRCATVAISAGRHYGHERVLTEREIAFAEAIEERPIASAKLGSVHGRPRYHRADIAILTDKGTIAIEVELTPKAPQRLRAIITAWCRASWVAEVHYLCAPGQTRRAVERAVA
jgi:DNA-binding Lrp family transcriptional regulator